MSSTSSRSTKPDIYTRVTDQIIEAIEAGTQDFEMPWHRQAHAGLPRNPATKKPYRGVNTLGLWVIRNKEGYASSYWASYLQWKSLGAQVRCGEKGSVVVFYKREEESPDEEGHERTRAVLRHSHVFNGDQVNGWEPTDSFRGIDDGTLSEVDRFVDALESDTRYGSDFAYYAPSLDRICMPNRAEFYDTKSGNALEAFYAVLLHEHIHWSGHPSRLNRDLSGRFGSERYAMEELVAELGAAFLCASLGISTFPRADHAAYMQSWLKVLNEQKSAIFVAASAASAASMFLETLAQRNSEPEKEYLANPA